MPRFLYLTLIPIIISGQEACGNATIPVPNIDSNNLFQVKEPVVTQPILYLTFDPQ